jgi:hypothetical protein
VKELTTKDWTFVGSFADAVADLHSEAERVSPSQFKSASIEGRPPDLSGNPAMWELRLVHWTQSWTPNETQRNLVSKKATA